MSGGGHAARAGAHAKHKKGGHDEEEHENHERWLVSYADVMTLLMVLFIVLFAISQVDQKKFAELKNGLAVGFGNPSIAFNGGETSLLESSDTSPHPGVVAVLDAITINLADGHYLKLKMTLQATTDAAEAPDGSKALDIAIGLYSGRKMDELMSDTERDRTKKDLVDRVVKAYTVQKQKEVMDIYFTTFVIQ